MIRVALKGLARRKLRAALTAVAIVLGVAMISGTYILTDTIKSAFGTVFTEVYKHSDVVITRKSAISEGEEGEEGERAAGAPSFSESLLTTVRGLPGVAEADGGVQSRVQLVGRNGKVISTGGAPGLGYSVHTYGNQRFNPLELVAGHLAVRGRRSRDRREHRRTRQLQGRRNDRRDRAQRRPSRYRIAGIAKIGSVSSLGGATMAVFNFPVAQRLFDKVGKLDTIDVADKPGYTPAQVLSEIRRMLPPNAQARTSEAQAKQATQDTNGFLEIIEDFLLAFAGVALFVGSFVIANTLSITIAQRTRELATLRTLGATQRQVRRSVLLEAFVIGLLASVVGLFLGLGLAKGLNSLFVSLGHRPAPGCDRVRHAHGDRVAGRRGRDHRARGAATGDPRHARAADRGGPRGRGAATVALCPLRPARGGADAAGRDRADADRPVRRRPLHGHAAAGDRARRVRHLHRPSACSPRRSCRRWPQCSAGRPPGSAEPPASSRAATPCATRHGRPRPPRR